MHYIGETLTSPLTMTLATIKVPDNQSYFRFVHQGGGCPDLLVSSQMKILISTGSLEEVFGADSRELRRAWELIRSILWRHRLRKLQQHLIVCSDNDDVQNLGTSNLRMSFEKCLIDARHLTFEDRWIGTLENLLDVEMENDQRIEIKYNRVSNAEGDAYKKIIQFVPKSNCEDGQTYACNELLAAKVYQFLFDEEYLDFRELPRVGEKVKGFCVTPKAIATLERHGSRRAKGNRTVFVVMAWEKDKVLSPLWIKLSAELKVNVRPVWGAEHIEKVDDRIFRELLESSAVIVDVTESSYNVGLEHGFALALKKQIILMKQIDKNQDKQNLPFDVHTHNCLFYDLDSVKGDKHLEYAFSNGEFERVSSKLKERIRLALYLNAPFDP